MNFSQYFLKSSILMLVICQLSASFLGLIYTGTCQAPKAEPILVGDIFGTCHAGYSRSDMEYEQLIALGNRWMRVDFSWSGIEPVNDQFNFAGWDAYLSAAQNHSQKVLVILDYSVDWLNHTLPENTRPYIAHEDIPYFLDYVNQTVRRYQDIVAAWEIWNEPNGDGFWNGTDEEFFDLFNQTADLINSINSSVILVGGVVAGHDPRYLEKMFQAGLLQKTDAVSFHPYSSVVEEVYTKCQEIIALGQKYNYQGEYWITEVGNPTGGLYGHRDTLPGQADRVIKTLVFTTISQIQVLIWYCLYDASDASKAQKQNDSELYFGLVYPNNTWKPGAYAFSRFAKNVRNSLFRPDVVSNRAIILKSSLQPFVYRRTNGETTLIIWFNENNLGTTHANIGLEFVNNATAIVELDIYSMQNTTSSTVELQNLIIDSHPRIFIYNATQNEDKVIITASESPAILTYLIGIPVMIGVIIIFPFLQNHKRKVEMK